MQLLNYSIPIPYEVICKDLAPNVNTISFVNIWFCLKTGANTSQPGPVMIRLQFCKWPQVGAVAPPIPFFPLLSLQYCTNKGVLAPM